MQSNKIALNISELNANHHIVSVHKYGFFLCRTGTARILLGSNTYQISPNHLCIYTPNTFFQILEKSPNLEGILEEDDVNTYHPVVSSINIQERLRIRNSPCVEISETQSKNIICLYNMIKANNKPTGANDNFPDMHESITAIVHIDYMRYLRYALCLKVLEAYFENTPVEAMPQNKEDVILNRFLVSVYENCHKQRTVQYYADEQHLSPYYFSSLIRKRSGKSALQWIENITMLFSRQYLECSEMSIKEISELLNFPDQSTFGRYFKHHEGCTPSDFRERKFKINL